MRRRSDPELAETADPAACRESALKLLERARRTRSDLEKRLKEKGFAATTVQPVLDRLCEVGLIDDAEYARAWLAGRWGRKPSGWRRLQQELRSKGVSDDDVERARELLTERGSAPDEVESARKVIDKARGRLSRLDDHKQRQRLYALLARRGFSADVIRRALEMREPLESGIEA